MRLVFCRSATAWLLLLASGASAPLAAQEHRHGMQHPHVSLTPLRAGTAADTARALALVRDLEASHSRLSNIVGNIVDTLAFYNL